MADLMGHARHPPLLQQMHVCSKTGFEMSQLRSTSWQTFKYSTGGVVQAPATAVLLLQCNV